MVRGRKARPPAGLSELPSLAPPAAGWDAAFWDAPLLALSALSAPGPPAPSAGSRPNLPAALRSNTRAIASNLAPSSRAEGDVSSAALSDGRAWTRRELQPGISDDTLDGPCSVPNTRSRSIPLTDFTWLKMTSIPDSRLRKNYSSYIEGTGAASCASFKMPGLDPATSFCEDILSRDTSLTGSTLVFDTGSLEISLSTAPLVATRDSDDATSDDSPVLPRFSWSDRVLFGIDPVTSSLRRFCGLSEGILPAVRFVPAASLPSPSGSLGLALPTSLSLTPSPA